MNEWTTVIVALFSGAASFAVGLNANKTTLAKAEKDNQAQILKEKQSHDSDLEKFYAAEMTTIVAEYKEQVSQLRSEIQNLKAEFSEFRKRHEEVVDGYKLHIEMLEEENESLKVENEHLKEELSTLKGETNERDYE